MGLLEATEAVAHMEMVAVDKAGAWTAAGAMAVVVVMG